MVQALPLFFFFGGSACQELVHAVVGATGRAHAVLGVLGFSVSVVPFSCQELVHAVGGATGCTRDFFVFFFFAVVVVFSCLQRISSWNCCLPGGAGGGSSDGAPSTVRPCRTHCQRYRQRGAAAAAAVRRHCPAVGFRRGPPPGGRTTCGCKTAVCWRGRRPFAAAAGVPG